MMRSRVILCDISGVILDVILDVILGVILCDIIVTDRDNSYR